jgi:hypothetical protein
MIGRTATGNDSLARPQAVVSLADNSIAEGLRVNFAFVHTGATTHF